MSFTRLLIFSLALVFALAACGRDDETQEQAGAGATTAPQTPTGSDDSAASEDAAALA